LLLKNYPRWIGFKYLYAFCIEKYKDKGTIFEKKQKDDRRQLCYEYCRNGFADCQTGTSFRDQKFFDLVNEMKDAISLSIGEPDL